MLDQFRGVDVRDDDGRIERLINFLHRRHWPLRSHADHNPVRLHQIFNREPLAQELRVAGHVEIHRAFDGLGHLVTGLHRHRAFVHDDLVACHRRGNFPRHTFNKAQVHRPVRERRRRHRNENDVRLLDSVLR